MGRRSIIQRYGEKTLRDLAASGIFAREAAANLGVSYQGLTRTARHLGIKFERPGTGAQDSERSKEFKRRYLAGETLQQIGDVYGITRERVRQVLKRDHGITACDGGYSVIAAEKKRKRRAAQDAKYQEKYGCSYRQYLSILREERRMKREGHPVARLPRLAFCQQRGNAKRRGIPWELSLWDWWVIWQESGKWNRRGRQCGGFCMCRKGDVGPYAKDNVYIATVSENTSVANRRSDLPLGVAAKNGRYVARRKLKGKTYFIGAFETPEEAHIAFIRFRVGEAA